MSRTDNRGKGKARKSIGHCVVQVRDFVGLGKKGGWRGTRRVLDSHFFFWKGGGIGVGYHLDVGFSR